MPGESAKGTGAGLPREVQEHLGRRLRTEISQEEGRPVFLGDAEVPPQFETLVRKLESSGRGERQGYEAVRAALEEVAPADAVPPPDRGPGRR